MRQPTRFAHIYNFENGEVLTILGRYKLHVRGINWRLMGLDFGRRGVLLEYRGRIAVTNLIFPVIQISPSRELSECFELTFFRVVTVTLRSTHFEFQLIIPRIVKS